MGGGRHKYTIAPAPFVDGQLVSGSAPSSATVINADLSHWIDLFRWTAAFSVVLAHGNRFIADIDVKGGESHSVGLIIYKFIMGFSHPGIMIFFVISGFLVGGTAWREIERTGTINVTRFLQRRLIRLWIVIVPALLATFIFDSIGRSLSGVPVEIYADARSLSFGAASCNVAFLQTVACDPYGTNGALWTLYNEFWYYLLCVSMLLLFRGRSTGKWTRAGLVIFIALLCVASLFQREGVPMLPYFSIWLLGALAAAARKPTLPLPAPILLILVIGGIVGFRVGTAMSLWSADGVVQFLFDIFTMALFAAFLTKLRFSYWRLHPLLARPSVKMAGFSFTVYCFHVPLMNFMAAILEYGAGFGWRDVLQGADWVRLSCQILFVLLVCYLISNFTEKKTDKIRNILLRNK